MFAWPVLLSLCQDLPSTPQVSRLESGLRVIVLEDHSTPLVSIQLWYQVGSADDDVNAPGLCHLSRLVLESRRRSPRLAANAWFESRTLLDACYFAWVVTPQQVDDVLADEAERMKPAAISAEAYRTACQKAPDECEQPNEARRRLLAGAFANHPYRHLLGANGESGARFSAADVQEFIARRFVPSNATLLVIGDVIAPQVLQQVRARFEALPWSDPPHRARLRLPPAEYVMLAPAPAERAGFDLAWVTPAAGTDEDIAIDVLMQWLCNPIDGPLNRSLAAAGYWPPRWKHEAWRQAGLLVLAADKADRSGPGVEEARQLIRAELERATTDTPSEIALDRARALAAREARNRRWSFRDRALDVGYCEIVGGDLRLADWHLPRIRQARVGDLQRAAACLLEARTVLLPRLAESRPQTMSVTRPATRPARGRPTFGREVTATSSEQLGSNMTVAIAVARGSGCVEVRTVLAGGPDLAGAVTALMGVGSARHTVEQLRDYLSYHGLDMFPIVAEPGAGLVSRGPATHLAQMLELQAELLLSPGRNEDRCRAAAGHFRQLSDWLKELQPVAHQQLYLPPGLIGWTVGPQPPTDVAAVRTGLERLAQAHRVEVHIGGDVEPSAAAGAAKAVWQGRHPHPP